MTSSEAESIPTPYQGIISPEISSFERALMFPDPPGKKAGEATTAVVVERNPVFISVRQDQKLIAWRDPYA